MQDLKNLNIKDMEVFDLCTEPSVWELCYKKFNWVAIAQLYGYGKNKAIVLSDHLLFIEKKIYIKDIVKKVERTKGLKLYSIGNSYD